MKGAVRLIKDHFRRGDGPWTTPRTCEQGADGIWWLCKGGAPVRELTGDETLWADVHHALAEPRDQPFAAWNPWDASAPKPRRKTTFSDLPGGGVCRCLNDRSPIVCPGCRP